ncbi:hypothetical protein DDE82_004002 [Stemphylium lycopersici]|uniref:BTB domain-containing protein n=1 Tax=Stemphylium lycopersici TaxID=183478 RepID=A0A364MYK2_STELY|nr:hypothetical protein TW65_03889 [Stemphylium lycopersici]RAR05256.1 hypothetical protein DDE82_004002 [Stemphylium lycopersici]RAR07171.1 hypothetical protein DDE83_006608 [Stemphylium lycopersici]
MADNARPGFAQKHNRYPRPNVVPAIPYRLSKAKASVSARPMTPESNKGIAAPPVEQQAEQQAGEKLQQSNGQSAVHGESVAETPPTPESRASGDVKKEEAGAPRLGSFPAKLSNEQTAPADAAGGYSMWAPACVEHVLSPEDVERPKNVNGHARVEADAHSEPRAGAKPVVNGAHRKRTIPEYLPPPFVPSSKAGTQTPPVNGSDAHTPSHRYRLSGDAVVFQSANESPVKPMTPQEAHVELNGQNPLTRPPPGFGPHQFAPFPPGPAQFPPEAGAPWPLPPHSQLPNGTTPYPGPPNGHFPSTEVAFAANGITSHAQSPTKTYFAETPLAGERGEESHPISHQDVNPAPEERAESVYELASYLSDQLGNPEFADIVLQVRSHDSVLMSLLVHRIVVARSPVIAEAVRRSAAHTQRNRDGLPVVDIRVPDSLATRDSLEEAISVLYGAPLLDAPRFLYGLVLPAPESHQSPSPDARHRMRQILSYFAAARTFRIPIMHNRGVALARLLMRWDTVDLVLQYALQVSPDAEDPSVSALINSALDFIAYEFPLNFKLHTIAPEFQETPRLPILVEPRQPAHNPRLSNIRFGDAPPENDLQPSLSTGVLSTILLSLPHFLIQRIFNQSAVVKRITWPDTLNHLRDLVNERENRRQKALRGQLQQAQDGSVPAILLNNLYLEESLDQVEPSHLYPLGLRLVAKRMASDT